MLTTTQALERILDGASADEVESEGLDFKRPTSSKQDTAGNVADAAACFANARGGSVVVGIADGPRGPAAFVGTDIDAGWLRQRIYELTRPSLDARVQEVFLGSARLLEVVVQEGLDVYISRSGAPTRRFEKSCLPLSTTDMSRLHDERQGSDWSATDSGRGIDEIDARAELHLRSLIRATNAASRDMSDAPLGDLLSAMALRTTRGRLTRAGELLLCPPTDSGGAEVIVYQYRETVGGEVRTGRRWGAPLLTAFVEAMQVIEARIDTTPVNLPSGQQVQIQDYPTIAIREALANAVAHGDHRDHRPVYIEHSPEMLEVRSPGPLVSGISPANILTHPPKARFPALAEAMRSLGLAEKWGQGVDRMFREMIRSGRSVPVVSVQEGDEPETMVRFMGGPPNARIAKFISTLPAAEQDDTDTLLIVSVLATRRTVSAETLSAVVQREPEATQAILNRLANGAAELIEPTPRSISRRYPDYRLRGAAIAALGTALSYQPRPRVDSERKIYAHVREYGSINNGTLQRMFDMDVYAARDMLREMVGKQTLVRVSEQTRGTAVRYGPGRRFPVRKVERGPDQLPPAPGSAPAKPPAADSTALFEMDSFLAQEGGEAL